MTDLSAKSDTGEIKKGLAGVVVDTTAISKVMEATSSLTYRGYAVQDLATNCRFEEVAYLLLFGDLPTHNQRHDFLNQERSYRALDTKLETIIDQFPVTAHPMDTLRTAVSFLGCEEVGHPDATELKRQAIRLLAKIPTIIARHYRLSRQKAPINPRVDLSIANNFFYMCFGTVPEAEIVKCFDTSLTLYAEHGFNASTFTARVIASTQADLYGAVTGGIAALKGPLHGGANEAVMRMMLDIDDPKQTNSWLLNKIANKDLVMGFGHRVYKHGDSRVPTMEKAFLDVARLKGGEKWVEIYTTLKETMLEAKGIYPNLDFPTGPAYYLMGFDIPIFTPIFVISRVVGWAAHFIEQTANNKLIRPLSAYIGPEQRPIPTR